MSAVDFAPFLRGEIPRILRRHETAGGHRRRSGSGAEPDLYGTAAAIGIRASLGEPLPSEAADLLTRWTRADGRVVDSSHGLLHSTATAIGARYLLGERSAWPAFLEPLAHPGSLGAWLDGLDWSDPWLTSHDAAGLFAIGTMTDRGDDWIVAYLAWLDAAVDPTTGLWHREAIQPLAEQPGLFGNLGASYHFHFLYAFHGRALPHAESLVDTCLLLAESTGWVHSGAWGFPHSDWALSAARASAQSGHRADEVGAHLRRLATALHDDLATDALVAELDDDLHRLGAVVALIAELARALPDQVSVGGPCAPVTDLRPFI